MSAALGSMLLLAGVCWVMRIAFVTLLPAERLPAGFRSALDQLAPAVLAAIIAVEVVGLLRRSTGPDLLLVAAAVVVIGATAHLTHSLWLVSVTGLTLVLVLDLLIH